MTEIKDINNLRIIQAVERKLLFAMPTDRRRELGLMKHAADFPTFIPSIEENERLADYYSEEIGAIVDEIERSPEGTEARRTALRTLAGWLKIGAVCKDIFGQGDGTIYARKILNKEDLPHSEGKKLCSRLRENYIEPTVFLRGCNAPADFLYYRNPKRRRPS